VIGVALMYFLVFAGSRLPLEIGYGVWMVILFAYIFLASVAPVWVLLQPRDFLNSFLLYGMILFGVLGIFVARPEIRMDTDVALHVEGLGYLFPVLFVTVACGAISGFHSLVASGTTSKQIDREEDARVIGYGGMLIESLLAVVALISVIVLLRDDYVSRLTEVGPVTLFSQGVGGFMAAIGIPYELGVSFVALTVSAFALTTLDTCTRLARYIVQEYFEGSPQSAARVLAKNRYVATTVPVFLSVLLLTTGVFGTLWSIF